MIRTIAREFRIEADLSWKIRYRPLLDLEPHWSILEKAVERGHGGY